MPWWDRPSGTCRPAPVGVGRRLARWCAGAGDGMGHLHHGGSWSNPRVRARRSAPRLGGGGGPRRRFLRRTARRIMPVPRRRRRRGRAAQQISAVGPGGVRGSDPPGGVTGVQGAVSSLGSEMSVSCPPVGARPGRLFGPHGRVQPVPPHPLPRGPLGGGSDGRPKDDRVSWIRPGAAMPRARVPMGDGRACRPGRGRMLGGLDVPRGLTGAARGEDPAVPSVTMTDCGPGWRGRVARVVP